MDAAWPLACKGIRLIRQIRCHIRIDDSLVNKHQDSTVEILLLGDKPVTQQQLFEVKATAYSSRSISVQTSVLIPALKGMVCQFLTVERAKTSMGRW